MGSKKQAICELAQQAGFMRIRLRELRSIQSALRERRGRGDRTALSYIAAVLRQAGMHVDYDDPFTAPPMREPYASFLSDAVEFHDLASAERSLRRLDAASREYSRAADHVGVNLVRTILIRNKLRAEALAKSSRVAESKRREKREIAQWFRVWLENPEIFFDWLEVRKKSEDFRQLFLRRSDQPQSRQSEKASVSGRRGPARWG